MADLPEVNSLLFIAVNEEGSWRSRVEDVDGQMLTVAAPLGKGDLEVPDDGAELEVFWTGTRARYVLPVRMMGQTRDRPPRWHLLAVGRATRQTRRSYVRGGGGGPAEIVRTGRVEQARNDVAVSSRSGGSNGPQQGTVIDISEGGVRCRMDSADLIPGDQVRVRVRLGDAALDLNGSVLLVREQSPDGVDVVVVYQLSESDAQTVRRYVFQWEIAERRRQLDSEPIG